MRIPPRPRICSQSEQWLHAGWCSFVLNICFTHDCLIRFFHNIVSDTLFTTQYVPYCTTKYIFWGGEESLYSNSAITDFFNYESVMA